MQYRSRGITIPVSFTLIKINLYTCLGLQDLHMSPPSQVIVGNIQILLRNISHNNVGGGRCTEVLWTQKHIDFCVS